jgi:hypothetical protein
MDPPCGIDKQREPKVAATRYSSCPQSALKQHTKSLRAEYHRSLKRSFGYKFLPYDHFTLVNRGGYEDVGGWDTYVPYYMTDCDMHSRLSMHNWTLDGRKVGVISNVKAVLKGWRAPQGLACAVSRSHGRARLHGPPSPTDTRKKREGSGYENGSDDVKYWRKLHAVVDNMVA